MLDKANNMGKCSRSVGLTAGAGTFCSLDGGAVAGAGTVAEFPLFGGFSRIGGGSDKSSGGWRKRPLRERLPLLQMVDAVMQSVCRIVLLSTCVTMRG